MVTVFDTGPGPNLIRADIVPEGTRLFKRNIVRLLGANKTPLETLGVVSIYDDINGYACRQPFVVTKNLSPDAILGTTFMERHCDELKFCQREIILSDGTAVPILRRSDSIPTRDEARETMRVIPKPPKENFVRIAQSVTLPPNAETVVKVVCGRSGLVLLEPKHRLYSRRKVSLTNGITYCLKDRPFPIRVANFANEPRTLSKNQVVGYAACAPETLIPIEGKKQTQAVCQTEIEKGSPNPEDPTDVEGEGLPSSRIRNGVPIRELLEEEEEPQPDPPPSTVDDIDLSHLDKKTQRQFRRMLMEFQEMWSGQLGQVQGFDHKIEIQEGAKPYRSQLYRAGPKARAEIKEQLTIMKEAGVITESQSEWASPVVLVPKKDGSLRFCVDYRRLNSMTVKDSYPLPRMEDCIDSLGDAKYLTTLDCNAGYWQIPVHPRDRSKTAFVCHEGCFEYCRMPFGLTNAPATFQRAVDMILGRYRWKSCLVYLDDIIVFSKTKEDHVQHVKEVLSTLKEVDFSLKLKKCEFFTQTVDYLGHVIHPGRLEVAKKNTEAVKNFKPPRNQTELRSFLGLCNVYRRFVPNFARTSAPLNTPTKGRII